MHIRIAVLLLLVGCANAAAPAADGGREQLRLTTIPDASCTLRARDAERGGMPLRSSHSGQVTLEVRRVPSQAARPLLQLDCIGAHGSRDTQRLDLELLLQHPAARELPDATPIRPALTRDLRAVTQRELDLGGYPRRPNAPEDSDDYQRWEEAVTMPMRVFEFDAEETLPSLDAETSGNWCGAVASSAPYEYAYGGWVEPHLTSDGTPEQHGSIWVGIGGNGPDTLIQAGTLQDFWSIDGYDLPRHRVVREVYPQMGAKPCNGCTLEEGDRVQFSARIENDDGNGGGTGVMYYWNVTRAEMASAEFVFDSGFTGGSAEWIMEDYGHSGIGLVEFGTLVVDGMETFSAATDSIPYGASESHTDTLRVNDHDYCKADVTSDTSIAITRLPN